MHPSGATLPAAVTLLSMGSSHEAAPAATSQRFGVSAPVAKAADRRAIPAMVSMVDPRGARTLVVARKTITPLFTVPGTTMKWNSAGLRAVTVTLLTRTAAGCANATGAATRAAPASEAAMKTEV